MKDEESGAKAPGSFLCGNLISLSGRNSAIIGLFANERDDKFEQITSVYPEAVSPVSDRIVNYGVWRCVFYQGKSRDFPDFQCAVCGQSFCSADSGNSDDHHALCVYRAADPDPAERLSPHPAHAASGSRVLRLSYRFWRVGGAGDKLRRILAAVARLSGRHPAGCCGSEPGS